MIFAKENPFSSDRVESLAYRQRGFQLDHTVAKLAHLGWRGAIVGRHGTGKTTLLIDIARFLQNVPLDGICYPRNQLWIIPWEVEAQNELWLKLMTAADAGELLLVDGIERLSWIRQLILIGLWPIPWKHRKASKEARKSIERIKLLATAHRPTGLPTLIRNRTSPAILGELLKELHPTASPQLLAKSQQLFISKRGNIRDVFWELYDHCADGSSATTS